MEVKSIDGETLGPCPFCDGSIAFSRDRDGGPDGMIHSLPTCKRFEDEDALTFIRSVRKEISRERT